jgi:hypothetical protein
VILLGSAVATAFALVPVTNAAHLSLQVCEFLPLLTFNPMFDDQKTICIQLEIGTAQHLLSYKILVAWMTQNMNTGEALSMNIEKVSQLWDSHSK